MAQLHVRLTDEQMQRLQKVARARRTPVSWLIRDYVEFLTDGGEPITPTSYDLPTSEEMLALAAVSQTFAWLHDEPDLYTWEDGEPV